MSYQKPSPDEVLKSWEEFLSEYPSQYEGHVVDALREAIAQRDHYKSNWHGALAEVARLREALRWYANGHHYKQRNFKDIYGEEYEALPEVVDYGERARHALRAPQAGSQPDQAGGRAEGKG